MRAITIPALLGLTLVACRPMASAPARYIVTTAPLDVRGVSPLLCIAVDPADLQGIWWWQPGRSGCSSRSTGAGVFRAEHGTVAAPSPSGAIEIHFQLQLIVGPGATTPDVVDVGLVLEHGGMRAMASGARVPTERRNDLEVPE